MLPVLVERKSWNDLHDTMRFGRWDLQIRKMKACGLLLNFLLIEGCVDDLRHVTQDRKDTLQADLERLSVEEGFHVGRTSCWSKSSAWLFWMTHILASAYTQGQFEGETMLFSELQSRVTKGLREMRNGHTMRKLPRPGPCHKLEADQLVTAIFRESLGEKRMEETCRQLFQGEGVRQLLVLRDMDTFNKDVHHRKKHRHSQTEESPPTRNRPLAVSAQRPSPPLFWLTSEGVASLAHARQQPEQVAACQH